MVARDVLGKELERYVASEVGVFGKINNAHTSVAQLAQHPIVRNGLPNEGWCRGHAAILAEGARLTDINNASHRVRFPK